MGDTEKSLIPITRKDLAVLSPRSAIEAVVKTHSEVRFFLNLDALLDKINQRVFSNCGKIQPVRETYSISPEWEADPEGLTYARIFALQSKIYSVFAVTELLVAGEELKKLLGRVVDFSSIGITISQGLRTKKEENEEVYVFNTSGRLYFNKARDSRGNWGGKPTRLAEMVHGRNLHFPLSSIPPAEEISSAILKHIDEILGELYAQGLLPDLNSATDEPDPEDTEGAPPQISA